MTFAAAISSLHDTAAPERVGIAPRIGWPMFAR